MAQQLVELCSILIEDTYGELAAHVWTVIADHGRSTLTDITHKARVPSRELQLVLPTLILHNLILHYTNPESNQTYYSVEWANAYNLIRIGRIGRIVSKRYGDQAAQVVENVAQLGHVRVSDLADAYDLKAGSKHENGSSAGATHVNGDAGAEPVARKDTSSITSLAQLHDILRKLLRAGFLVKTNSQQFQAKYDVRHEVEEQVITEHFPDRKVTGPKKQKSFNDAVKDVMRKRRAEDDFSDSRDRAGKGTIYRAGSSSAKRQKINGRMTNGAHNGEEASDSSAEFMLPDHLTIRVNHTKCVLALRSERYERAATQYLGDATAAVYGALLQALEPQVRNVRDELADYDAEHEEEEEEAALPRATVVEVSNAVDQAVELSSGIKLSSKEIPNGFGKKHKKVQFVDVDNDFTEIGIKQERDSDDDDEDLDDEKMSEYRERSKRYDLVEKHLKLLQEHPKTFCNKVGSGSLVEWTANFPSLTEMLIASEIDATVNARFGKVATRLVRLLREKGKLEEKQVAAYALMRAKDVRVVLADLHAHGFAESQELPKDNSRQPSRTLFLWYFDQKKVQQMLLYQCYQSMSRAFQRLAFERQRFRQVIQKAERFIENELLGDHEGKKFIIGETGLEENTPLRGMEKQQLKEWREIEERFLGQIMRLDDMVVVLRDFSGRDTTLIS